MKKYLLVFCYIVSVFLSSCSKDVPPKIKGDFEAVVTVRDIETDLENFLLKADISVENSNNVEITVISPKEISGLSYIWGEEFEMVYKNLHCKTEKDYLPQFSFSQGIYNVLNSLYENDKATKSENGDWLFKGESQSGEYEVQTDSKGYIQNISIKEIRLCADFEYSD
ncbi:MAG: hypothetical protein IKB72_05260 [Ruminococcus sp.]|nr:hypothetical protein [Ruminococcus sp.]